MHINITFVSPSSADQLYTHWLFTWCIYFLNCLYFRSKEMYTTFELRAYLCMEITKITEYSFQYYLASGNNHN